MKPLSGKRGIATGRAAANSVALPFMLVLLVMCLGVYMGLTLEWASSRIPRHAPNARSETVAEKPPFRHAFRHLCCRVPVDGFYEWRREGEVKQPFRIAMKGGQAFAFAGLWESWRGAEDGAGDGSAIETFTALTTEANRWIRPIHPRMPVILPRNRTKHGSTRAWIRSNERFPSSGHLRTSRWRSIACRAASTARGMTTPTV